LTPLADSTFEVDGRVVSGIVGQGFGISGGGRSAEEAFLALTGAQPSPTAAMGDAVLKGHPIEIKRASSNTLNQVRAVKYITLVVYYSPTDDWYVVPAHVVVAAVSVKSRGQHTENPFESSTLSVGNLHPYKLDDSSQLRQATLDAIAKSAKFPALKEAMDEVLLQSKGLAASSLQHVRQLLRNLGLP
jgi:hypothetical protein